MPCQELNQMSGTAMLAFLKSFDVVMTDCDGVLWHGSEAIERSADVVRQLRELGKKIFYCTNNSTKSRKDYVEKCQQLGFGGTLDEMVGTSYLAAQYLKNRGYAGKVYIIGTAGVAKELEEAGIPHIGVGADVVPEDWTYDMADKLMDALPSDITCVICGFDDQISYFKLAKATSILSRPNSIFVATNTDEQFPWKDGLILPGTGAIVTAISTAAGREPVIMGKPSAMMFDVVKQNHPEIRPERTLMIGDRANTDILLGKNCGLQTLMVGSGVHSLDDIREWEKSDDPEKNRLCADFFIPKLGDLLMFLKEKD